MKSSVASPELIELLLSSVDIIDGLIRNARDNETIPASFDEVYDRLIKVNSEAQPEPKPHEGVASKSTEKSTQRFQISFIPSHNCFEFGTDPLLVVREIKSLGNVLSLKVDDSKLPELTFLDPEKCYLSWQIELEADIGKQAIEDVGMFLDNDSKFVVTEVHVDSNSGNQNTRIPTAPSNNAGSESFGTTENNLAQKPDNSGPNSNTKSAGAPQSRACENETVRVDRNRLDILINQIGELVIGASMVEQDVLSLTDSIAPESLSALGKIVRDLQEMSLGLRMVPIASAFQKMQRVLRDLSKKLNKQIDFITEGDDTELDKTVVDQISDPLIHMVRNSIDHGIESTEDRIAAGKSPVGKISLRAYQQGGNIYIQLSDDGKGLDRNKIRQKAIERGLVQSEDVLTDAEICHLIFKPGFSTAEKITDVSGRGVGMDVVRKNVEALQGSVTVTSEFGKGSTVTVRLPLTLAILDGLLVRLTNEVYVVPLLSVVESIAVECSALKQVVRVGEVIQLRGEVLPVLRLHRLLDISEQNDSNQQILLVIVEDQGRRFALRVDELLGQQQVVIKNLETNFRKVPGVAGATILGDGRVALILDLLGLSSIASNIESQRVESSNNN
ncbi:MAG: chemotaxis protein CheA [Pirellulales bacterium]